MLFLVIGENFSSWWVLCSLIFFFFSNWSSVYICHMVKTRKNNVVKQGPVGIEKVRIFYTSLVAKRNKNSDEYFCDLPRYDV